MKYFKRGIKGYSIAIQLFENRDVNVEMFKIYQIVLIFSLARVVALNYRIETKYKLNKSNGLYNSFMLMRVSFQLDSCGKQGEASAGAADGELFDNS